MIITLSESVYPTYLYGIGCDLVENTTITTTSMSDECECTSVVTCFYYIFRSLV